MPLTAKGEKIKAALEKTYGSGEKAKQVLYAGQNKGIFTGIDDAAKEAMDELETARAIAAGELSSPQLIGNLSLYAMRVSGTGVSYRRGLDEFVWRDPALYLSQDMIDRCAGLPVIMEHPKSNTLNSDEFADRVVGGCMFGYVKDDELWCIARIYDDEVVGMMEKDQLSTSPAVVFKDPSVNNKITLDGKTLLIEGKPSLLDHLAICERGVWDKGGDPTGIDVARKDSTMPEDKITADKAKHDAEEKEREEADKKKADADAGQKIDKVLAHLDSLNKRMDAYDAKADAAEKARHDAEEKEKEEKEKDDKAKKDAEKVAKAKKDEWDDKEEKEEKGDPKKLAADKAKKDDEIVSGNKTKKADEEEEEKNPAEKEKPEDDRSRKDAQRQKDMQRQIADIEARMPKHESDEDHNKKAHVQSDADVVFSAFGDSAPRPMDGETLLAYRRRLATKLKHHSNDWKDVDLGVIAVEPKAFDIVEKKIYADAMTAATQPMNVGDTLREVRRRDPDTGHMIKEYYGSPMSWMAQFTGGRRLARFNLGTKGDAR